MSERKSWGLSGPVKSVFVEVGAIEAGESTYSSAEFPFQYIEFNKQGQLTTLITYKSGLTDTAKFLSRTYDSAGNCIRSFKKTEEKESYHVYHYDSSKALLREEIYQDSSQSKPERVILYHQSSEGEISNEWIKMNVDHPYTTIIYRNSKQINIAHQWIIDNEDDGFVPYDIDTVPLYGRTLLRVSIPSAYLDCQSEHTMWFYDTTGQLQEKRMFDPVYFDNDTVPQGCYDEARLKKVEQYDQFGKLTTIINRLSYIVEPPPLHFSKSTYGPDGGPLKTVEIKAHSFLSMLEGESIDSTVRDEYVHKTFDSYGNWVLKATVLREMGSFSIGHGRTIEYY